MYNTKIDIYVKLPDSLLYFCSKHKILRWNSLKALVIGAAGFVGHYLLERLALDGWKLCATKMPGEVLESGVAQVVDLDILDPGAVEQLLKEVQPDAIFHLAAQSSVAVSWKRPELTVDVNVKGTVHVLEAVRSVGLSPRILLVGSGEEYGHVKAEEVPIGEDTVLRPGNLYAATKAAQNMIGAIYAQAYHMPIMMVRAFNHVGPNQSPQFVVADFCKQVAEIEAGKREPVLRVGNLSAKRDFSDVRDVVRAYSLLIHKGVGGETYNVGSGKAVAIQQLLDMILSMASVPVRVEVDPSKLRPVDVPVIEADTSKIRECTGWMPQISLDDTIRETLDYWRRNIGD